MWVRYSALAAALYAVVGLVVVLTSLACYLVYRRASDTSSNQVVWSRQVDVTRPPHPPGGSGEVSWKYGPAILAKANQRLEQLRSSLARTSALLEQRTVSLNRKNAECRALQTELNQTVAFVFEVLAEAPDSLEAAGSVTDGARLITTQGDIELEMLREELRKSEFLEREQAKQLAELEAELVEAAAEIAELAMAAEQEINALVEEKDALDDASREALVEAGSAAVPALVALLSNERSDIRAWAASVLGDIGPDARDAVTSLNNLLNDPDEKVRTQAQDAITMINLFSPM